MRGFVKSRSNLVSDACRVDYFGGKYIFILNYYETNSLATAYLLTNYAKSTIIQLMQKFVEEVIDALLKAFSEKFDDFHGLYLYGVFTDGKPHTDEDIEIAAIFDTENKEKRELIWPIIGKIETDLDVFIDLHPITMEDLKKDEDFYDEVVNKGRFFRA